jgi:antitoxin Phd
MRSWRVQDAKVKFSQFLEASITNGPQVVTRRGVEAAVLVSMNEWHRLQGAARPNLKDLLLAPEPRFDDLGISRGRLRQRVPCALR